MARRLLRNRNALLDIIKLALVLHRHFEIMRPAYNTPCDVAIKMYRVAERLRSCGQCVFLAYCSRHDNRTVQWSREHRYHETSLLH